MRALRTSLLLAACTLALNPHVRAADGTEWPAYGNDPGGSRHAAVTDIDARSVHRLKPAWTYRTGHAAEAAAKGVGSSFQATPILAEGRLYLPTPFGQVIALDPGTGKELWRSGPGAPVGKGYSERKNRGVTFWRDGEAPTDAPCAARVFVGRSDGKLLALDAATGQACGGFGEQGVVDLTQGIGPHRPGEYNITSPAALVNGVLVVGAAIGDNGGVALEHGVVRGIDARTGRQLWSWDPIPRQDPDAARAQGWEPAQAAETGAANAWAPLAADTVRDLVFIPTGSASPDFWGGKRLGDNRWANSLVALRASTGAFVWGQQLVRHDLWDYDTPAQPLLIELERDGRKVPAVVQATKMGLLFTFHRETGEPLFPLEERPVPQTDVPGEVTAPTQRFPVAPAPLHPHKPVTPDDAWGISFWDRGACRDQIAALRSEGIYTPPSLKGTLGYPGYGGGSNWGGLSADPARGIVYANLNHLPTWVRLVPRDSAPAEELRKLPGYTAMKGTPYVLSRGVLLSPLDIPCTAPPWGTLAAVDMNSGAIKWQVPLGTTEKQVPLLKVGFGMPNMGGSLSLGSGLVLIAAATDDRLRAFDGVTGAEVWSAPLPAGGQATPMAYRWRGKSYVVIAAGGHDGLGTTPGDHVVAFALE